MYLNLLHKSYADLAISFVLKIKVDALGNNIFFTLEKLQKQLDFAFFLLSGTRSWGRVFCGFIKTPYSFFLAKTVSEALYNKALRTF